MKEERFPIVQDGVVVASAPTETAHEVGVLDTLLLEDGIRWFEDRHLARLRAACERFAIPLFDRFDVAAELARYAALLADRPSSVDARAESGVLVRTTATRDPRTGSASLRIDARRPRVVPAAGIELALVDALPDPLGRWKTTARTARDRAAQQAERAGCFEALLVLPAARIVEAARANVFAVLDGRVATPPLASGCLPGIVRGLLVESLPGVVERELSVDDLRRADEVWITSSGVRIAPVRAIRGVRDDYSGAAGPRFVAARAVLARLEAAYKDRTAPR